MLMIITRGSCLFGGHMYNLDSLVGVIPVLVFPRQSAFPEYVFRLCISDSGPGIYWAL